MCSLSILLRVINILLNLHLHMMMQVLIRCWKVKIVKIIMLTRKWWMRKEKRFVRGRSPVGGRSPCQRLIALKQNLLIGGGNYEGNANSETDSGYEPLEVQQQEWSCENGGLSYHSEELHNPASSGAEENSSKRSVFPQYRDDARFGNVYLELGMEFAGLGSFMHVVKLSNTTLKMQLDRSDGWKWQRGSGLFTNMMNAYVLGVSHN